MKARKIIRNVLLTVAGLVLALLVALQILLRPSVLTGIVNQLAAEYVQGDVSFRQVKAHVIKSFPYLHLEASDFAITYPHERYAAYDSLYPDRGRRFSLLKAGLGREEPVDTLAAFRELDLELNYVDLLRKNGWYIHRLELQRPRIFAHYYDSTTANWDILPIGRKNSSKGIPPIRINSIRLSDRPLIVFTNPQDTLHGLFTMRRLSLEGKMDSRQVDQAEVLLSLDSLLVSGRLPADTLSLRLDRLRLQAEERHILAEAQATARLATQRFGRLRVPVSLSVDGAFPKREDGALAVELARLGLQVATVPLEGKGSLVKSAAVWDLDLEAAIPDCPLGELIDTYQNNIPILKKISTDARLSLDASVKGRYGEGQTPQVNARLQVPLSTVDYEGLGRKGRLALDAVVVTDDFQAVDADVRKLLVDIAGAHIDASASVKDLLGKDPVIALDGRIQARVDSLTRAFTREAGISGTGSIQAQLSGKARLSQLNMAKIGAAQIDCDLNATDLSLSKEKDSLRVFLPTLAINLATRDNKIDRNMAKGARVLALKADLDTMDLRYGNMFARGGGVQLLMQNSADILKGGSELTPLMGILKVRGLRLRDRDGLAVSLRENTERFRITPASASRSVPRLSLISESGRLRVRSGANFYALRDVQFDVAAARHQARPRNTQLRNHILDSLQRVYPGVPRDSLFSLVRQLHLSRESRDAFASADIKISLSDAMRDYFRNWDIEGKLDVGSGRMVLPAFPLKTGVSAIKGSFDNDTLDLRSITVTAGASDVSAQAKLTGLRRAILGRGRSKLKLKADVQSNYLDANELLRGYAYYRTYQPPSGLSQESDDAVEAAVDRAQLPDSARRQLIVIPSNLDVDFTLEASGIHYDSLEVSWAAADVAMRDRTLQITNALAASNMGDIYFEGFYATRALDDIKTGFDLNMVHITAEKVITLFPAVDSILPLLTTFAGDLDCEMAATCDVDTCMNVVLPTIDGVMRISGKDLSLKESEEFTRLAKKLMFRNKAEARVDNMAVTGIIRDNQLEVFPFVLDVDRYLFAASGIQQLDKRFDYHISVIRSPLLVKFGVNAWGPDFDHIHYTLGKAKYRDANVPVYTKQLDTVQYSLIAAIHNIFELGVEKAMEENRLQAQGLQAAAQVSESSSEVLDGDALDGMAALQEGVAERTASRLEALKQEVLQLEEAAASKGYQHEQ